MKAVLFEQFGQPPRVQNVPDPTPSTEGAEVHFIDLKDGATVPTKVTIRFGLREMGVAAVFTPKDFSLTESTGGIVDAIRRANGLD